MSDQEKDQAGSEVKEFHFNEKEFQESEWQQVLSNLSITGARLLPLGIKEGIEKEAESRGFPREGTYEAIEKEDPKRTLCQHSSGFGAGLNSPIHERCIQRPLSEMDG